MVLSGAERMQKHRSNKKIKLFISNYLEGKENVTIEEFIEGKGQSVMSKVSGAVSVSFDHRLLNEFYRHIDSNLTNDSDGYYSAFDLEYSWKEANDFLTA
mgnify:CR=1 FL=1